MELLLKATTNVFLTLNRHEPSLKVDAWQVSRIASDLATTRVTAVVSFPVTRQHRNIDNPPGQASQSDQG